MLRLLPPLALWLACLAASQLLQGRGDADLAYRVAGSLAWLGGSWLVIRVVDALLWERLVPRRSGVRTPRLLRQLVALLLLALAVAALLSQVWRLSVLPVLAATGALGLIVGLALRDVLSDLFSGIALNLEQPFRLDDFVLLHSRDKREPVAGFVREINWRSTTVLTPEDNVVSVPNSVVARAIVENKSFPSPVYELELEIVLDWTLDLAAVEAVLGAAMVDAWASGATSGDKPPKFRIRQLDGAGVGYKIVYLIDPRKKPRGPARHALLGCLHRHLRFAGLRPVLAADVRQGQPPPPQRLLNHDRAEDRLQVIAQVGLLAGLTDAERGTLADGLQVRRVARHETVVRAGEPGTSMFIIAAGVLTVTVPLPEAPVLDARAASPPDGTPAQHGALSPGGFFGEMSLLTGAPRSATVDALCDGVLYEVTHELMAQLLAARPALAQALARVVAEHQQHDAAAALPPDSAGPQRPLGLAESIAARIRGFFGAVIGGGL